MTPQKLSKVDYVIIITIQQLQLTVATCNIYIYIFKIIITINGLRSAREITEQLKAYSRVAINSDFVPICTLQPSTSPPVQAQSSWWRVCWGSPLLHLLMSVYSTVAALAVVAASQNGPTWIMLMSPYINVSFHMLWMRLSTSTLQGSSQNFFNERHISCMVAA